MLRSRSVFLLCCLRRLLPRANLFGSPRVSSIPSSERIDTPRRSGTAGFGPTSANARA